MLFKNIYIVDEEFEIRKGCDVLVDEDQGVISKIYFGERIQAKDGERVYDGRGRLLMPGFVNAHAHSPMTLMRGYGENMTLQDWLIKKIFPFEQHLDGDAVYWGTLLAMAESLSCGITSTTDMYYFCEDMVRAFSEAGCKGNISRGVAAFETSDLKQSDAYKEMMDLYERFHKSENGRIKIDFSLHAEYTNGLKAIEQMAETVKSTGNSMHLHLSETKSEHYNCIERHGLTPAALMDKFGIFDQPTTAAHCVWITEEDRRLLRARDVTVAANPCSNMKLASGICDSVKLLEQGINVAIGTDSVASNNSLNFNEEIKLYALASKIAANDPTAITPKQAIKSATRNGYISQGRTDCGLVKEGFKADLIAVDLLSINMQPIHNLLNNIVYSSDKSNILMTMVDGKVLYEEGEHKFLDIEEIIYKVSEHRERILRKI